MRGLFCRDAASGSDLWNVYAHVAHLQGAQGLPPRQVLPHDELSELLLYSPSSLQRTFTIFIFLAWPLRLNFRFTVQTVHLPFPISASPPKLSI